MFFLSFNNETGIFAVKQGSLDPPAALLVAATWFLWGCVGVPSPMGIGVGGLPGTSLL